MKKNIAAIILTFCIAVSAPLAGCANVKQEPPENLVSPDFQKFADNYVDHVNNLGLKYCDADFVRIDYDAMLREPCYYIADAPDEFLTGIIGKLEASPARNSVKDKYGETYFEKYFVVVLRIPYSSGSVRINLVNITIKESKIIIRLESVRPQVGTCDMATFAGLISLSRTDFKREAMLEVYLNDRLIQPAENGKAE